MDAYCLIRSCTVCQREAQFLCQRCREPYCSHNCQEIDWTNHKSICVPMPALVSAAGFEIRRSQTPRLDDKLSARHPSQVTPLRKPAKSFQQNNPNFSLTTEVKSKVSPIKNEVELNISKSTNASFDIRNAGSASSVRTIHNDLCEATKNAPASGKKIEQTEPLTLKGENKQIDIVPKIGDSTSISPKIQPTTIPKPEEKEVAPKPLKVEERPLLETKKPLNSPEIRPMTIPKPVEIEVAPKPPKVELAPLLEMKKPPNSTEIGPMTIPKPIEMEIAPKPIKMEVPQKPLGMEAPPKQVIPSVSSTLIEAWMTPFTIEATGFVDVIVQFTPMKCSQTVWVMLEKNETASINLLREINKNISAAPNVKREEVKVNQLCRVLFEDIYYRGVTLEPITSEGLILVRLIDYGNELSVPIDSLKEAIPPMNKLNAFGFQIKFQTPREVAIGDVLKIQVKSTGDGNTMNVLVEGEVSFATKDDLEIVPIPIGTKTKLYCLDYSNIKKGYIAACVYDTKAIGRIEAIGLKISEYCVRSKDGYNPQLNELCLALYEDGEWYRAEVGKIIDANTFGIVFVDYGNMAVVKSLNIRKIPDEFMHPCLMSKCFIKGAPEKPTDADIKKIVLYFTGNSVFTIESATKENAGYMINVAELQW